MERQGSVIQVARIMETTSLQKGFKEKSSFQPLAVRFVKSFCLEQQSAPIPSMFEHIDQFASKSELANITLTLVKM